ncbi:MAG TPA: RNA 3'-terminal phosphate cyclase, partial [Pyrinomonadaceae bacterium]|nr:RNA 3'-terminal phosphate cyclase [Pyrinomonadaceae bacterium]
MLSIDGSYGEGGGQIIRTSLALSLITGKPFRVYNVRARRDKPGLQRQHLTAVTAAAAIGTAKADGAHVGSKEFTFEPGAIQPGEYKFTIGTAGSTMLVLQAILPPLMLADAPSLLLFEGGTHNVKAPPFEFIRKSFLPLVNRTGPTVTVELQRYGFYPPGGGRFNVYI